MVKLCFVNTFNLTQIFLVNLVFNYPAIILGFANPHKCGTLPLKEDKLMKASITKSLSVFTILALCFGIFSFIPVSIVNAEAVEYLPFSVVFTAGMHGNVKPFDYKGQPNFGGFAKAKTKIDEVRKQVLEDKTWWQYGGNTMVLDIGNTIMGSQTGWFFANTKLSENQKHPTIEAMNAIKYDAMSYGAGEFSLQPAVREQLHTQSSFKWINANVVVGKDRSKLTDEYQMMIYKIPTAAHPLRFGIVGLANPAVFNWEDPNNLTLGSSKLALDDYVEKAREHAESLKETGEKADFIVVMTDLGLQKNADGTWKENELYRMIQEVTHVDFICSSAPGQSIQQEIFTVPEPSGKIHETLVCQLPEDGVTMGRMDFVFEKCTCPVKPFVFRKVNGRRDMKSRFMILDQSVNPDKDIMDKFRPQDSLLKTKFDVRIGESKCEISSTNARRTDNPIAELACNVMMKETDAQFAITDIWSTTATIKKGSFTFGELFNLFPKDSKIYKMTLTGQQLENALSHAATLYHTEADTNFIIGKGFNYYLDIRPGVTDRVGYMMIGNSPIDPKKTYTVATNSYIALGQGGYKFEAKFEPTRKKLLDAIQNYIKEKGGQLSCNTTRNWFVVPDYVDHWANEYIDILISKKIVSGDKYGRYNPDANMTRAEASKILLSIYDLSPSSPAKSKFKDVPKSHWAYGFIEGGVKVGMWSWMGNTFGLNANVTREEVFTNIIFSVGAKAQAEAISPADMAQFEANFADASTCSPWAKKYIAYGTKVGIVGGIAKDGKLYVNPKANIKRGEVATIMAKARFPMVAVMATSDVRTEIDSTRVDPTNDRKIGGWNGLAYTVGNIRALYDKNVLLDAGGMISGTAWAELAGGKMATGFMNALGYDAMTFGIRDFYLGGETIKARAKEIPQNIAVLAANVEGIDGAKKSVLKNISGIKVGIVGAVDPDTNTYICDGDLAGIKINQIAQSVNAEIKALKSQGAEIVVVIASASGYIELGKSAKDGFKGPAAQLASQLSGANIMFISGAPMSFVAPTNSGIWVISSGIGGSSLGFAKVRFDAKNRSIDAIDPSLNYTYNDLLDNEIKPAAATFANTVKTFVEGQRSAMKADVDRVIGRTETGFDFNDSNESLLGDFITEYASDKLGVDIIVFPSDQTKKGIAPGSITVKDVYQILPIDDTWVKGKISGAKIKEICESSVSGERGVLQLWGLSFVFTRSKDPGNRVSEAYIIKNDEKTPVDTSKTYSIAMPSREYHTLPGFGHEVLRNVTTDVNSSCIYLRKTIFEYIKKLTEAGQPVNQAKRKFGFVEP